MSINAITICAPTFDHSVSYGKIAWNVAKELEKRGVWVNYIPGQRDAVLPDDRFRFTPYTLFMGHPTNFEKYGMLDKMNSCIAVTMWESTLFPDGWTTALNNLKGVVVPSEWCEDIFKRNVVTVPIMTSPLGLDPEFTFKSRTLNPGERFRVLTIGDRGNRRNWWGACRVFGRAFGVEDMSVEMIIKVHADKGSDDDFRHNFLDPNFTLIKQNLSTQEMAELFQSCHVLLYPARGEGFGLPPLEFLRTGGVAICTDYSGLKWSVDFGAIPIPYELQPAWQGSEDFEGCGNWAEPDLAAAVTALKNVRESYSEFTATSETQAKNVAGYFTWEKFVTDLMVFWEGL